MPSPTALTPTKIPLTAAQKAVAKQIVTVGQQQGATDEEILGALAAADVESKFDPFAVGDHGLAIGVFQQHPSYGSDVVRTSPLTAAKAFFERLIGTRAKGAPTTQDIGTRVANVQRPAAANRPKYGQALDEALYVFETVTNDSTLHDNIGYPQLDLGTKQPSSSSGTVDLGNVQTIAKKSGVVGDTASGPALQILHTIDDALQGGGILDLANNTEAVVARGACIAIGIGFGVAGMVLIISAILSDSSAKTAAGFVPGGSVVAQTVS